MYYPSQHLKRLNLHPGDLTVGAGRTAQWLQQLWTVLSSPLLLGLAAAAAVVAIVLMFHTVVTQAVSQGALRQQALTARSQAIWHCQMIAGPMARQNCLSNAPAAPGRGR